MTNLLESVKQIMTDSVIGRIASLVGIEKASTSSALGKFLPAIIGGLIKNGSTESGAEGLLDLFKNGGYGDVNLDHLEEILGDSETSSSWMNSGSDLLGSLFGNSQSGILDALIGMTGINKSGGSSLLKLLAPIVVNKVAAMVFKNNWGTSQLMSFLGEQKSTIDGLLPGLSGLLGYAAGNEGSSSNIDTTTSSTKTKVGENNGGNSWLKWFLPLLLIGTAIWYFTKDGCGNTNSTDETIMVTDTTSLESDINTSTSTSEGTSASSATTSVDMSSYELQDNGDIVDGSGNIVYPSGSYGLDGKSNLINNEGRVLATASAIPQTLMQKLKSYLGKLSTSKLTIDGAGNLVDESGKVILAKGNFVEKDGFYYDKQGNRLGKIWGKIIKAISDAADKTIDAMKGLFSKMVKKEEGVKTDYVLSDISFNKENHRIIGYSIAEVEGLAAALKENAEGKIVVQAFTNDGKDDKDNKKMSETRAKVVYDMLVTLGVPKGQISFDGMGSGENKVQVRVK